MYIFIYYMTYIYMYIFIYILCIHIFVYQLVPRPLPPLLKPDRRPWPAQISNAHNIGAASRVYSLFRELRTCIKYSRMFRNI